MASFDVVAATETVYQVYEHLSKLVSEAPTYVANAKYEGLKAVELLSGALDDFLEAELVTRGTWGEAQTELLLISELYKPSAHVRPNIFHWLGGLATRNLKKTVEKSKALGQSQRVKGANDRLLAIALKLKDIKTTELYGQVVSEIRAKIRQGPGAVRRAGDGDAAEPEVAYTGGGASRRVELPYSLLIVMLIITSFLGALLAKVFL